MEEPPPLQLSFTPYELDEANARLSHDGNAVPLTPKAFAVLCALARQPGKLVTKGDLLDAVWGHRHVSESVLKTVVSELRTAMGDDAKQPRFIETVPRRGYRFAAAVSTSTGTGTAAGMGTAAGSDASESAAGSESPAAGGKQLSEGESDKFLFGGARPIGRRPELARALAGWTRIVAGAGARRIVWITGEAGIGKSTLIDLLAAEASPSNIARGHCVEQFGSTEPYLPVLEALGDLCRVNPALRPLMRSVAPTWLVQMPWLCSEAERVDLQRELSGSHPDRMLREFCELVDRYTPEAPLLLVTEDLHWSDHATIRLIDYFARSRGPARVLWLGSFRPADAIAVEHPLTGVRHELRASGFCDEIALDPFSEREVADYLAARFPSATAATATESFVRSLHATTEGLPLFVVNVVDDLMAQGTLSDCAAGGFPRSVSQVPESVAGVIERRIARLTAELQSLLEVAAVSGVEFRASTLARLAERDRDWVVERCESLVRRQYWLRQVDIERLADGTLETRYRFRHPLYREVFYARIGAHAKARLHLRLAQLLEQRHAAGEEAPAAEIAVHFDLGHDALRAVRHFAAAVENALERYAAEEAQQLLERAIALLPRCPPGEERLGLEFVVAGRRDAICGLLEGFSTSGTRALLERARSLSDVLPQTPERGWVAIGIGWGYFQRGDLTSAQVLAKRVQSLASTHDDQALLTGACSLAGSTATLQGELVESARLLEEGLALYARTQASIPRGHRYVLDPSVVMHASMPTLLCQRGLFEQARRHAELALRTAEALGAPLSRMVAYRCAAALEVWLGRREHVLAWSDALGELAREHNMSSAEGPSLWFRGWASAVTGEVEAGQALIDDGLASRERLGRLAGITHPIVLAVEAQVLAGRWATAQGLVDQGFRWAERLGERVHAPELWLLQARTAWGTGQTERARNAWVEALQLARTHEALWLAFLALTPLAELDGEGSGYPAQLREVRGSLRNAGATLPASSAPHLLSCLGLAQQAFAGQGPHLA
jgi:DNA-binding winged helix-turn-helix (wHTH) protein/tetratricopeptide (TPR) repeat protein